MFNRLDQELQKELIDFCKAEEADKTLKPLNISLAAKLLRQITKGEREITGMITNDKSGDVFVRFSFTSDESEVDLCE